VISRTISGMLVLLQTPARYLLALSCEGGLGIAASWTDLRPSERLKECENADIEQCGVVVSAFSVSDIIQRKPEQHTVTSAHSSHTMPGVSSAKFARARVQGAFLLCGVCRQSEQPPVT
jgi:hypothetical protein